MALPNFSSYYWASNIIVSKTWLKCGNSLPQLVSYGDKHCKLCLPCPCCVYQFSLPLLNIQRVRISLKIWTQFQHFLAYSFCSVTQLLLQIFLPPSLVDKTFTIWYDKWAPPLHHFFQIFSNLQFRPQYFLTFPLVPEASDLDSLFLPTSKLKWFYFDLLQFNPFDLPKTYKPLKPFFLWQLPNNGMIFLWT